MKILNFGSLNLDNVYQVPHFLQAGETMAALSEAVHPGGKGLNQSLALARAGAEVYHAGVVGNGSELLTNLLKENGVHDDYLLHRDCTQGSTMIQVSPKGENCILLFGQSNHAITKAQLEETIAAFAPGDYLVLQNEVSCLPEMVEAGAKRGLHVVLNPSPFDDSLRSLDYNQIRWIFINEVEGHQMTGENRAGRDPVCLAGKVPRAVRCADTWECRVDLLHAGENGSSADFPRSGGGHDGGGRHVHGVLPRGADARAAAGNVHGAGCSSIGHQRDTAGGGAVDSEGGGSGCDAAGIIPPLQKIICEKRRVRGD